jgi:hypothetical protein
MISVRDCAHETLLYDHLIENSYNEDSFPVKSYIISMYGYHLALP